MPANGQVNHGYDTDDDVITPTRSANHRPSSKTPPTITDATNEIAEAKNGLKNGHVTQNGVNGVEKPHSGIKNGQSLRNGHGQNGHMEIRQKPPDSASTCGLPCWKPQFLSKLAHPLTFVLAHALLVLAQSILVSGYISGSISTIEIRFNFQSVQSGAIVSSYEATCIVGVILVSYIGGKFNRSHWLSYGAFIIAIGSFLFVIPHAVGGLYEVGGADENSTNENLCNSLSKDECGTAIGQMDSTAMGIFIVAMLVIGFGASPVYTLGPTYLYDNCKRSNYGLYIGIVYCCGAVGPAAGFMLSALLLSYYVDIGETTELNENDSRWVGAWWLGFLICGFLNLLAAIPLLFFPRTLPAKFSSENSGDDDVTMGTMKSADFKDFPQLAKSIFSNLPWLFVSLAAVMEASVATGFTTFIAKFLQVTYSLPPSRANIVAGGVVIPGACSGIMIGGYLMKKLQLPLSGVARLCCLISTVCVMFYFAIYFLGCSTISMAGVTENYAIVGSSSVQTDEVALINSCNSGCSCSTADYSPVCGDDGLTYFNPCYAGCTTETSGTGGKNYSACGCINPVFTGRASAVDGACQSECVNLYPLLVVLFLIVVLSFMNQNPALLITLGCVEKNERSLALGLQSFLVRIIAYIPAPIYFGYLFDSQCILWQRSCGETGACLEYDRATLPAAIFGVALALKTLSILCTLMVWISSRNKDKVIIQGGSEVDVARRRRKGRDVVADMERRLRRDADTRDTWTAVKA